MRSTFRYLPLVLLSSLPASVLGSDILSTNGFSTCAADPSIKVQTLNVEYNRQTRKVTFDIAGSSAEEQKVLLNLVVSAYGKDVYTKEINPCEVSSEYNVEHMCPSMLQSQYGMTW